MRYRTTLKRRDFLKTAAAAGAACAVPTMISASALGADGKPAPSQRINVAMIGVGRQAKAYNVRQFLEMPDVHILAVCDVDSWRLANGKQQVETAYGKHRPSGVYKGCDTYGDFHDVLTRKDLGKFKSIGRCFGAGVEFARFQFDLSLDQLIYDFPTSNYKFSFSYQF